MSRPNSRGTVTRFILLHTESAAYWSGRAFVKDILGAAQYLSEREARGVAAGLETATIVHPLTGTFGVMIRPNGNDPRPCNLPPVRS